MGGGGGGGRGGQYKGHRRLMGGREESARAAEREAMRWRGREVRGPDAERGWEV